MGHYFGLVGVGGGEWGIVLDEWARVGVVGHYFGWVGGVGGKIFWVGGGG